MAASEIWTRDACEEKNGCQDYNFHYSYNNFNDLESGDLIKVI